MFDFTGKVVIPLMYDFAGTFHEGLARAEVNGKWGYIDDSGKRVIPFVYDKAKDFSNGTTLVEINGENIRIDKYGRTQGL